MLRVALAQINTIVGNLEGNYYKIAANISNAQSVGADIVVFPEMAITGYPPEDLLFKPHFIRDNQKFLKKLIKDTAHITAIVGFVDKDKDGNLYNAAAIIHNKKIIDVYHKANLPNYSVFDEKRYFTAGTSSNVFSLKGITFGVNICEDIWIEEGPCQSQAKNGAQILFNVSSSPYHFGKVKEREKILKECAKRNKTYVCYTNLVGGQDELVFDGGSLIIDSLGKTVVRARQFDEDFIVADLDVKFQSKKTRKTKMLLFSKKKGADSRLFIKGRVEKSLSKVEEIYKALVTGTYDYVKKNGFKKVVIGISGGVDSALVSAIAVEALGKDNVIGISMPSKYSSSQTKSDAKRLASNLGIRYIEMPIQKMFNQYLENFAKDFKGLRPNVAEENLQARIRGNILMTYSNKFGWLVLTTGNKSEVAVGYCTLYGDMSGGFAVIKDVPKTQVYEICRYINKKEKGLIPLSILKRAPSAELKANQKDQDFLPPYGVLDEMLKEYVEDHRSLNQMAKRNGRAKIVKKVIGLVDQSEYKRRQAPPGIKITPRAFGKDWRLPITNKYKES